jgi:peptidoglycan L-alanyl-D-glutamate endopeptidase CwlK
MIVAWVFLYLLFAAVFCILFFMPTWRGAIHDYLSEFFSNRLNQGHKALTQAKVKLEQTNNEIQGARQFVLDWSWRYRWWLALTGLLLITPPILVFLVHGRFSVLKFNEGTSASNEVIASLLQGEQLVPPPPLPPELFTTLEVEQLRPRLDNASRNWQQLDKSFEQRLLMVYKIMEEQHGYKMVLLEGYRSPERQNMLAAMGSNVTNSKAFQSYHQYGLAADSAFIREGKLVISEKDPWAMRGYELYGEVAESLGMTWGGRWKMMDFGHVELRPPGGLRALQKQ